MELSIIIPVYNTKIEILKRCIDSIVKIQKLNYEVIIIDDGSLNENSVQYKEYISKLTKKNINYIKKENGGVSSARNLGIKQAKGNFIMFVDSDDILCSEKLLKEHLKNEYDVIFYNYTVVKDNRKYEKKEINATEGKIDATYIIKDFLMYGSFHAPYAKLIKRKFLENFRILFNTDVIQAEDAIFNLEILEKKPRIYYVDSSIYQYFYDFSTFNNRWLKYPKKMLDNYSYSHAKELYVLKKYKFSEEIEKKIYSNYIKHLFRVCMVLCDKSLKNNKKILIKISEYVKKVDKNIIKDEINVKIKFLLLKYHCWIIICILSKIRNFYLKFIKRKY